MISLFKDLQKLRPLITKRDMWKFAILFVLMFFASILEAVGIGVIPVFVTLLMKPSLLAENSWIGSWFTNFPPEPSTKIVLWASLTLVVFIVSKNIFLASVYYVQARIVQGQRVRLCSRMFRAYQAAPYEWHLQRGSSELLRNILNDTGQVLNGVIMPLLDLQMGSIMSFSVVIIMMLGTPGTTLVSLLILGVGFIIIIRIFQKVLYHSGEVARIEDKVMIQAIQQGFGALVDSRIIGCEGFLARIFHSSIVRSAKVLCSRATIQKGSPLAIETLAILGFLFVLLMLMKTSSSLNVVLPTMSLLGVATIRLKQTATRMANSINQLQSSRAFIPGIVNDLRILDKLKKKRLDRVSSIEKIGAFEIMKMDNVTYFYPNTKVFAVQEISLEIRRGESIAFVGATGCGKSTLVNLILGLLEPHSGTITVNGTDVFADLDGWRTNLGYIPQSIFLVDDSLRSNIAFGVSPKEIDDSQVEKALRSARLYDFVQSLPMGIDTIVGERGVRLSGGQRQRLGIARTLYFDPDVLVMDEATSALDNQTEAEVMEAIENLKTGRTFIMVAHRLSTVQGCDRLYYFAGGHLIASGSFEDLKQSVSDFSQMVARIH